MAIANLFSAIEYEDIVKVGLTVTYGLETVGNYNIICWENEI